RSSSVLIPASLVLFILGIISKRSILFRLRTGIRGQRGGCFFFVCRTVFAEDLTPYVAVEAARCEIPVTSTHYLGTRRSIWWSSGGHRVERIRRSLQTMVLRRTNPGLNEKPASPWIHRPCPW